MSDKHYIDHKVHWRNCNWITTASQCC